jgi:quercetin dioxygenase-like cupin family protein
MKEPKRESIPGTVVRLSDLVRYQEGAIASKMVLFRKNGTITVFAFDQGEGLPEHTAPYEAVVTVLEGTCRVTIAGVDSLVQTGQTILFPPHIPHAVYAVTPFKMSLTMIRDE